MHTGTAAEAARWQVRHSLPFIPPVSRFFVSMGSAVVPLTVKDGRRELEKYFAAPATAAGNHDRRIEDPDRWSEGKPAVLEVEDVWFAYENGREALKGANLTVARGDFLVILGENAAGKSTLLKLIAGILKPGRGRLTVLGDDRAAALRRAWPGRSATCPES